MENTIVQLSKYVITFLMICFTVQSFAALKERDEDERHYILMRQIIMIILMNFICFFVMFLQEGEVSTIQMFLLTMAYILGVQILYRLIYRKASMILVNNMCMLLSISMIILTRLSVSKAMSQYKILAASTLLCFIIPVIVRKGKFLKNLTWIYAVLGIAMLSVVMVLGFTSGGAKLSIEIHGITFQLSEIAKITLVFFMAGMLREDNSFGNVVKATVIAAVHVLILVASTDLGTAFVFFMAYVVVIYVATRKARYPLLGLAGMSAACVVAYFLFSHVRNRVALWQDPIGNWDISSQIPVVIADSGIESDLITSTCATDHAAAAKLAADHLCEAIGNSGEVAIVAHQYNTESSVERVEAFKKEIEEKYTDVKVVQVNYGDGEESIADMLKNTLETYPALKGIFCTNEDMADQTLDALADMENTEQIQIVGFDSGEKQQKAIQEGREYGTVTQNPYGLGYAAIVAAVRAIQGLSVDQKIDTGYQWLDKDTIDLETNQKYLYN